MDKVIPSSIGVKALCGLSCFQLLLIVEDHLNGSKSEHELLQRLICLEHFSCRHI